MEDDSGSPQMSPEALFSRFVWRNLLLHTIESGKSGTAQEASGSQITSQHGLGTGSASIKDYESETDDGSSEAEGNIKDPKLGNQDDSSNVQEKFLDILADVLAYRRGQRYATAVGLERQDDAVSIIVARPEAMKLDGEAQDAQFVLAMTKFMASCYHLDPEAKATHLELMPFLRHLTLFTLDRQTRYRHELLQLLQLLLRTPTLHDHSQDQDWSLAEELLAMIREQASATLETTDALVDYHVSLAQTSYLLQMSPGLLSAMSSRVDASTAERFSQVLRKLARPLIACYCFIKLSVAAPEFRSLKFVAVPDMGSASLLPVEEIHLDTIKPVPGAESKLTASQTAYIMREYDSARQGGLRVHPEVVLASHLAQSRTGVSTVFPYMGISRQPCKLCEACLKGGQLGLQLECRSGHQHLLPRWGVPRSALQQFAKHLQRDDLGISRPASSVFTKRFSGPTDYGGGSNPTSSTALAQEQARRWFKRRSLPIRQLPPIPRDRRRSSFVRMRVDGPRVKEKDDTHSWSGPVPIEDRCVSCAKAANAHCKGCKSCNYCSPQCQVEDWDMHKKVCRKWETLAHASTPTSSIMLFLPADGGKLQLVRLDTEPYVDDNEYRGIELSQMTRFLFRLHLPESMVVKRSIVDCEDFRCTFVIHTADKVPLSEHVADSPEEGMPVTPRNVLVDELVRLRCKKTCAPVEWRGPILVVKEAAQSPDASPDQEPHYEDFLPRDLNLLAGHFGEFGNEDLDRTFPATRTTVKGVKVFYNVETLGVEYESVEVPLDMPIWDQAPTQISERVGFPIIVRKYTKDIARLGVDTSSPNSFLATLQSLSIVLDKDMHYSIPTPWMGFTGTVILVRQDRRPLLPGEVKAMCWFCKDHLLPRFETYIRGNDPSLQATIGKRLTAKYFTMVLDSWMKPSRTSQTGSDVAVVDLDKKA